MAHSKENLPPSTPGPDAGWSITRLADVKQTRPRFLWPGVIPEGLTLLAGDPAASKSLLTTDWAARVTTGTPWPDGRRGRKGSVLLLAAEDDLGSTILPRVEAAGGDPERVFCVEGILSLRDDVQKLDALLNQVNDVRLIIIDPVNSYLGGQNTSRDTEIRAALTPLLRVAARHRAAIIGVMHLNKAAGLKPLYRVLNSIGLIALARAAWLIGPDPRGGENAKVLASLKCNLGPPPRSIGYRIVQLPQGRGRAGYPTLEYTDFDLDITPEDVLGGKANGEAPSREAAVRWLHSLMSVRRTVPSEEVEKLATAEGISTRTLLRAKKELEIVSVKKGATWFYTLDGPRVADAREPTIELQGERASQPIAQRGRGIAAFLQRANASLLQNGDQLMPLTSKA